MNVYRKIQKVIVELQSTQIKKSGKNKFAGYDYFELSDILPNLNILLEKHGLFCQFNFYEKTASLTVHDTEKEGSAEFVCTTAEAKVKGCQEVQNLGAVQTYIRRYLLVNTFAISESDVLDRVKDDPRQSQTQAKKDINKTCVVDDNKIDKTQRQELFSIANDVPQIEILDIIKRYGYNKSTEIDKKDFEEIIKDIKLYKTLN